MARLDHAGKIMGHLTVRELTPKIKGVRARKWICWCDCGKIAELSAETVREMREGKQRLVKSLPNSDAPDPEIRYFLEPNGQTVTASIAISAIDAHELVPLQDGLFDGLAQTWVPA